MGIIKWFKDKFIWLRISIIDNHLTQLEHDMTLGFVTYTQYRYFRMKYYKERKKLLGK